MRLIGMAETGIRAQQITLDTIANNIANVNTPGFKANRVTFTQALSIATDFQQGTLTSSDRSLDLGIDGSGFFEVTSPDGKTGYTRGGSFQVDASGQLTDMQGNVVQPGISIPSGTMDLAVALNGEITGVVGGAKSSFGQIPLVVFQNPEGLQRIENNLFVPTVNSGAPQIGQPGTTTGGNQIIGMIHGQYLEQSNVDLALAMTDLIQVQKAYQVNTSLAKDGDQMWGIANAMRR